MSEKTNINTEYLTGKSEDGLWSGVFMSPPESHNSDKYGQIFGLISLSAPKEFDSKIAGDLLIENIQDVYFEDSKEENIISRLEKSILSTAKRLEHLLQREKIAAEEGIDLNIVACVILDKFVYMALLGEGGVMLMRDGNLINLTEGLKDLSGRSLIRSGSGKFINGDKFILLSSDAVLNINELEVKEVADSGSTESIKDKQKNSLFGLLLVDIPSLQNKTTELGSKSVEESSHLEEQNKKCKDSKEDEKEEFISAEGIRREDEKDESSDGKESSPDLKERLSDIKDKVKNKVSDRKTYQVLYQKFLEFVSKVATLFKKYIWNGLLGLGKGSLYIRGAGPKPSIRGIIILIVLVVSILYLSINGINKHKEKTDNRGVVEQILSEVDEKFSNGRNLGEAGSISESVSILEEAIGQLDQAREYEILTEEIDAKKDEGLALLDEIRKVILLTNDNLITDIGGYIENADASDMVFLNSSLYICDTSSPALYSLDVNGGEVVTVFSDDSSLSSPDSLTTDSEGNVLINDLENGLMKYNVSANSLQLLAGLSSTTLGDVATIENYTTNEGDDILYLLRPSANDIRKILKYTSGYASPELRLAESKIGGSKDLEIDGKIYILTSDNSVIRYYVDQQDPYTLVGLDKEISDATSLELDAELVYIGDKGNSRVLVFLKGAYLTPNQGEYIAQIIYRGDDNYLADIREVVVDNESRVMYILDGTKIFRVDLSKVDEYAEAYK